MNHLDCFMRNEGDVVVVVILTWVGHMKKKKEFFLFLLLLFCIRSCACNYPSGLCVDEEKEKEKIRKKMNASLL
jgi:hypothetical protein